jgi:ribosome recycling factor
MIPELLKDSEDHMKKSVEAARHEFEGIRTGRANPALLDDVKVEAYGSTLPVNQVAAISVPEPRQLLITPYDRAQIAFIEKAILKSDINITPNNDGNAIRLTIPPLNEERRKELGKIVGKKAEEAKAAIRNIRHNALKKAANPKERQRESYLGKRRKASR